MKALLRLATIMLLLSANAPATALDGAVLREINFARTNPAAYADALPAKAGHRRNSAALHEAVAVLRRTQPLPRLELSAGLAAGAAVHVREQAVTGAVGHRGSAGSSPGTRMAAHGRWVGAAAENISYGQASAEKIVAQLMIDEGVPGRQHRRNLLSPQFQLVGVASGTHSRFGTMCVMKFAADFIEEGDERLRQPRPVRGALQPRIVRNQRENTLFPSRNSTKL